MPGRIRTVNVRKSLDTSGIAAAVRGRSSAGRARKSYCSGASKMLRDDVVRVEVEDLRRVEAGLRGVEGPAEGALALRRALGERQADRAAVAASAALASQEVAPAHFARLRLLRGVDVDVLPPVLPVRWPAVADQPGPGEVGEDAVHAVLVRHVGEQDALGLARTGRSRSGPSGSTLHPVVDLRRTRSFLKRARFWPPRWPLKRAVERRSAVRARPRTGRRSRPSACRRARSSGSRATWPA